MRFAAGKVIEGDPMILEQLELGRNYAAGVVVWQCAVAWLAALIVRLIGLALGGL